MLAEGRQVALTASAAEALPDTAPQDELILEAASRLVRSLLPEAISQAGRNEAVRGEPNDEGRQAVSAVYLYRL